MLPFADVARYKLRQREPSIPSEELPRGYSLVTVTVIVSAVAGMSILIPLGCLYQGCSPFIAGQISSMEWLVCKYPVHLSADDPDPEDESGRPES